MRKSIINLSAILVVLLLIIFTQYMYGNLMGHDMIFHVVRLDVLIEAIKDNTSLVYIDSDAINGYGYATKLFYSDFFLIPFAYIGQYLKMNDTYSLVNMGMSVTCAIISFISIKNIGLNKYIAYCFTLLYTFSLYRLSNIYDRNALGEALAMTFSPLLIWGYYEIIFNDYKKWYILSIGYGTLMLSHILSTIIFSIAGGVLVLCTLKYFLREKKRIYYFLLSILGAIIISAYSLFPLIEQLLDNRFYAQEASKAYILNFSIEEVKFIIRGFFAGISFTLVKDMGIGILITIPLISRIYLNNNKQVLNADKLVLFSLIFFFIISPIYPINTFPFNKLKVIQFSFRLYTIIVPILALAASIYFVSNLKTSFNKKMGFILIIVLIGMQIISSAQKGTYLKYKIDVNNIVSNKNKDDHYSISGSEYLPERIPNIHFFKTRANDSIRIVSGTNNIESFKRGKRNIEVTTTNSEATTIELPLIYYKGYKANINNHDVKVNESDYGLIQLTIQEKGTINVFFGGTIIQKVSPYITIFSFIILFIYIYFYNRKKKENNKAIP